MRQRDNETMRRPPLKLSEVIAFLLETIKCLFVSLSRCLVVSLSRRITWVFLEAQLTTPNVILKAADYITTYLPIAAPIPYENPLD